MLRRRSASSQTPKSIVRHVKLNIDELESRSLLGETVGMSSLAWLSSASMLTPWFASKVQKYLQQPATVLQGNNDPVRSLCVSSNALLPENRKAAIRGSHFSSEAPRYSPETRTYSFDNEHSPQTLPSHSSNQEWSALNSAISSLPNTGSMASEQSALWNPEVFAFEDGSASQAHLENLYSQINSGFTSSHSSSNSADCGCGTRNNTNQSGSATSAISNQVASSGSSGNPSLLLDPPVATIELAEPNDPYFLGIVDNSPGEAWEPYGSPQINPPGWQGFWKVKLSGLNSQGMGVRIAFGTNSAIHEVDYGAAGNPVGIGYDPRYGDYIVANAQYLGDDYYYEIVTMNPYCDTLTNEGDEIATAFIIDYYEGGTPYTIGSAYSSDITIHDGPGCTAQTGYLTGSEVPPDTCSVCNASMYSGANIVSSTVRFSTGQACACGANPSPSLTFNSNYDQTIWRMSYTTQGGGIVVDPPVDGPELLPPPGGSTPAKLRVKLYWDGSLYSTNDLNIDGSILTTMPMDYYVQHRGADPGCYAYTITTEALDINNVSIAGTLGTMTGNTRIGYSTEFGGPGWSLGLVDRLFESCGTRKVTRTFGNGLTRVYTETSPDVLVNGVDRGKLTTLRDIGQQIAGYVYRDTEGVTHKYNALGYMTNWISADGAKTITYGYSGNLLTSVDWYDGSFTTVSYTGSGSATRLSTIKTRFAAASGLLFGTGDTATYTMTYDAGMLSTILGPDLRTSTYSYSPLTFPSGTFRYLSQYQYGNLVDSYQYDSTDGLISLVINGTGANQTGTYTYTPMIKNGLTNVFQTRQFSTVKDPLNRTTSFSFDDRGFSEVEKYPDGGIVTYTRSSPSSDLYRVDQRLFDPVANTDTILTTSYGRDSKGYPTFISYPDGSSESFTYTDVNIDTTGLGARHLVDTHTNERGIQTKFYYDAVGHAGTIVYDPTGLGLTWKFGYSIGGLSGNEQLSTQPGTVAYGNLLTYTDAKGNVYLSSYDNYGRLTLETRPAPVGGTVTYFTYTYDAAGNLRDVTTPDPDGGGSLVAAKATYSYDNLGRVTGITEAQGLSVQRKTTFTYNSSGQLFTKVDPLNRTTTYLYDSRGLVTMVTEPTTRQTKYLYDAAGQMIQLGLPRGFTYTYDYDQMGRMKQVTTPSGILAPASLMTITYDTAGWVRRTQDFNNNVTTFAYDNAGRATGQTQVGSLVNLVTSYAYDQRGNLTSVTDPRGNTTAFQYDNADRMTLVTYPDPDGAGSLVQPTMAYAYDANSNVLSVTDTRLTVTSYAYDALDRNTQIIRGFGLGALAQTTNFLYNNVDQLTAVQLPGINALTMVQTTFLYDNLGRVISTTEATNDAASKRTFTFAYDAADRQVSTILPDPDGTGALTVTLLTYTYDTLDRVTQIRTYKNASPLATALLRTVTYNYDAHDNVTSISDPLNRLTTFSYDVRDRLQTVTTPAPGVSTYTAAVTTYQYDGNSNLIQLTQPDPDSNLSGGLSAPITTYIYDSFNRLTQLVRPDPDDVGVLTSTTFTYAYDSNGNQISVTDPLNHIWTRTYDTLNRVATASDPLNQTVTYRYEQAGSLLSITDPESNSTTYGYDALSRMTTETNALLLTRTYTYDNHDNVSTLLDRNNHLMTFSYDGRDRKTGETWRSGPLGGSPLTRLATYTYDLHDRSVNANDTRSNVTFTYDDLGRVSREDTVTKPIQYAATQSATMTYRITYTYDAADQRTGMTQYLGAGTTTQQQVTYTYDNLGRLKSETQLTFTAAGAANNGLKKRVDFTYDQANRLSTVQRFGFTSGNALVTAANSQYAYDNLGRATSISHKQGVTNIDTFTYTYDAADRLVSENSIAGWVTYTYFNDNQLSGATSNFQANESFAWDANGNPTGGSNSVGTNNRLNQDANATYTYDQEGRRISRRDTATGATTTYSYDQGGRLTGVTQKNSSNNVIKVATYAYDSFGRRLGSTVDPDGAAGSAAIQQTRWVYDGQNNIAQYTSTNTAALAINNRYLHGSMVDMVFADENIATTVTRWTLTDIRGSVRDIANNSGTLLSRRQYNSFGDKVSDSVPAVDTIFGYTSREYDANAGLQYQRARYYDPKAKRFVSEDPIGFGGGDANLSRYTGNGPTNGKDPSGLLEADDRRIKATRNLVNVASRIEKEINAYIEAAWENKLEEYREYVEKYNKEWGRYDPSVRPCMLGKEHFAKAFVESVYESFGKNRAGTGIVKAGKERSQLTGIGADLTNWLSKDKNEIVKIPFLQSRYRNNTLGFGNILWGSGYAYYDMESAEHMIAPTINVNDTLIGTDKIEHFFQQGYWYFDLNLRNSNKWNLDKLSRFGEYLENKYYGKDGFEEREFYHAASCYYGEKFEAGLFGYQSTGVISEADKAANMSGYAFYRSLYYGFINGKKPKFSFTDFTVGRWNEQNNPNRFINGLKVDDSEGERKVP